MNIEHEHFQIERIRSQERMRLRPNISNYRPTDKCTICRTFTFNIMTIEVAEFNQSLIYYM